MRKTAPFGSLAEALNFPAVREDDLLHDGEAEAGAFLDAW